MKYILIPIVSVVICQVIKLLIYIYKNGSKNLTVKKIVWEGFWVGKFPSSHAALLTSTLSLLVIYSKEPSVIVFAFVVSLILIYSLLEDKKRHEILESYFLKSSDNEIRKIAEDGVLREFNGHSYVELITGVMIGLVIAFMLNTII